MEAPGLEIASQGSIVDVLRIRLVFFRRRTGDELSFVFQNDLMRRELSDRTADGISDRLCAAAWIQTSPLSKRATKRFHPSRMTSLFSQKSSLTGSQLRPFFIRIEPKKSDGAVDSRPFVTDPTDSNRPWHYGYKSERP